MVRSSLLIQASLALSFVFTPVGASAQWMSNDGLHRPAQLIDLVSFQDDEDAAAWQQDFMSPPQSASWHRPLLAGCQGFYAGVELVMVKPYWEDEVDTLARALAPRAEGDAIVWFAYPKASSKTYTCEFNRDTGWAVLEELGFKGVRQVAIDADWSALRFRRVEFVKSRRSAK